MCKKLMCAICLTVALASTSQAVVIGNWEMDTDGWTFGAQGNIIYASKAGITNADGQDVNGVTLDNHSLDIWIEKNDWNQDFLSLDLVANGLVAVFRANQKFSIDVTWKAANWPEDQIPQWNGIDLFINAGGDGWSAWTGPVGYRAGWTRPDGDRTITATWDYSRYFSTWHNLEDVWWLQIIMVSNCNDLTNYNGAVSFFLDNARLTGAGGAVLPDPAVGATNVAVDKKLSWSAGTYAITHDVYFGTDSEAVANANGASDPNVMFATVDTANFDPGVLAFNTHYYWRVDEVNPDEDYSPWKGPVWDFGTANFIIVDDFESYTNDSPNRVFQTWLDGLGYTEPVEVPGNGTGAVVGYDPASGEIMETSSVHGGTQAMPMDYGNNSTVAISETVRTWAEPQDWTLNGFDTLKLWVRGLSANVPDRLYVTIKDSAGNSATAAHPDAAILNTEEWTQWLIPVSDLAGVNMAAIVSMTIGIGNPGSPKAASGRLFVDDIVVGPKPLGLVAYYELEGDVTDSSGNGLDGTIEGDPNMPVAYVTGPAGFGKGMLFDGQVGHERVELGTFNPSAATGQLTVALWARWDGLSDEWQGLIGKKFSAWSRDEIMWQIETQRESGALRVQREGIGDLMIADAGLTVGQWQHVVFTFDGTTGRTYLDGTLVSEGAWSFGYPAEAPIQFGCTSTGGGNPFNGALDEVRLYDRALSAAEVLQLAGK
jgi:hypothetical protein